MPHTFPVDDVLHLLWGGQSCPQPPFGRLFRDVSEPSRGQRPAESRLQPGLAAPQSAWSLADETVDFVDGTFVAVGDDGNDFAPVAGIGGVFYELVVGALEELEILGVIDEEVIRLGDGIGQEFAFSVVAGGPGR